MVLKEFQAVGHPVGEDERPRRIDGSGYPDAEGSIMPVTPAFILERCAAVVGDADRRQVQMVGKPLRGPVLHRNGPFQAVPRSGEAGLNRFGDEEISGREDLNLDGKTLQHQRTGAGGGGRTHCGQGQAEQEPAADLKQTTPHGDGDGIAIAAWFQN